MDTTLAGTIDTIAAAVKHHRAEGMHRTGTKPNLIVLVGHNLWDELAVSIPPAGDNGWTWHADRLRVAGTDVYPAVDIPIISPTGWRILEIK